MSSFRDDLTVTQLSDRSDSWRLWRLEHNLTFDVGLNQTICVPAGFITDGPSIPQIFWNILPVWGTWARAGVLHDFLCCLISMGRAHPSAPDRKAADRMFLRAMTDLGVGFVQFSILYLGVTFGRWMNVRTTMVDYNVKLSGILDKAIGTMVPPAKQFEAEQVILKDPVLAVGVLLPDHPNTAAALSMEEGLNVVTNPVSIAKTQAGDRA